MNNSALSNGGPILIFKCFKLDKGGKNEAQNKAAQAVSQYQLCRDVRSLNQCGLCETAKLNVCNRQLSHSNRSSF